MAHDLQSNNDVEHSGGATAGSPGACDRRIEMVPISTLKPYKRNARTHTKRQIRQIADSIARFGFTNPVLIDDGGEIIAGHGRVEAAKQLSLSGVPALRLSHLSAAEKRAYVLADNKLAEKAGWDRELLAIELQGLINLDFEVELTGFEVPEIDFILEDADAAKAEASGPEDRIPDPLPDASITRSGDLWLLGKHRLLCGNALAGTDYERLLDGDKADFVFTDPLRNVPIDGPSCGKGAVHHREFAMADGAMTTEGFTEFLTTVFRHLAAHSKDGCIHDICMDWRHLAEMIAAGNAVFTELKDLCVWAKANAGMGSLYRSRHELVFIWKSGGAPHINNVERGKRRTNVWEYPGISTMRAGRLEELALHPTGKPTSLVVDAIKDCSRRNGIVLDPFLGSGTTLIAAERTGRRARGLEIDPVYVDVAVKRWQDYTGKAATLAATGQTFEEVADERSDSQTPASDAPTQAPSAIKEAA